MMANSEPLAMHTDFPRWYAAVGLGDDQARLSVRWDGITSLAEADRKDIETLIRLAFNSQQPAAASQVQIIREAFKAADAAYDMQGNDRELQVMAGACLAMLMDQGAEEGAKAALGVSTAALGGARKPDLPMDLGILAENAIDQISETNRERPSLTGQISDGSPKFDFTKSVQKVKEQPDAEGFAEGFNLAAQAVRSAFNTVARQHSNAVHAMDCFIRAQDEELQMLWWLTGQRSEDLDCAFDAVGAEAKAIVFAKELADHTVSLPGPASVKGLLSRAGLKERKKIALTAAINATDSNWLQTFMPEGEPSPVSTPIHYGIKRQIETGQGDAWIPGWAAAVGIPGALTVSPLELGVLFYRERLILLFREE